MRAIRIGLTAGWLAGLGVVALLTAAAPARAGDFVLTSPDIADQHSIPDIFANSSFGCGGGNLSPALQWKGAPSGTRSFAVTVFDPDAPTGSGWWHWVVYNLPPSTDRLGRGAGDPNRQLMPVGTVQGRTDYGVAGYGGPCPPRGSRLHHYVFSVYALNIDVIPVRTGASAAMVGFFIHEHELAEAKLTAVYGHF